MSEPCAILAGMPGLDRERAFHVLAYGDPNVDLMFSVAGLPGAGDKTLGTRLGSFAGGTVANAGCAASALGCRTLAFGRVGDDADGRFLLQAYAAHGVATDRVRMLARTPSACAMVMIEPDGEKALVYAPMPGSPFDGAALLTALEQSALLYAMPYDIAEFKTVHALARAAGALVAIDVEAAMAPRPGDIEHLLRLADLVFMNDATYLRLFGQAPGIEHMRALLAHGARALAVTCGAAGALAVTRQGQARHDAFPAVARDRTGAGDCFNGAFLAALCEGRGLAAALRFACAAASFAVTRVGAREGIPARAEVDALLRTGAQPACA
ncbi:carbohydrate kinase family protein [Massilia sp. YIM B02443]|uniref:carbohydrate kinase family protein n=1 Tax=Massilia sp. YIM B02443 TaxID=3050127 RepID=UPI0025B671FE|nr:carbohydrate kinase family protein [Massilia sp. YIM B02443]MDN4037615.1 carbohydrate kinase family protein [Massilia sp. YIM B02443]